MRRYQNHYRTGLFLLLVLLLLPATALCAPVISAKLNTDTLPLNRFAQLDLVITREGKLEFPKVDGLGFQQVGEMTRHTSINGKSTISRTITLLVRADKEGKYTIPPFRLLTAGKNYATTPLTLSVVAATGATSSSTVRIPASTTMQIPAISVHFGRGPGSGRSGQQQPATGDRPLQQSDIARLQIKVKRSVYRGESVPVEIKLLLNPSVRFRELSLPIFSGENFALPQISEESAKQGEEEIDGRLWQTLTWRSTLTGLKVGRHALGLSADGVAAIPRQSRTAAPGRRPDIFSMSPDEIFNEMMNGDPFAFNDPFFTSRTRYVARELDLKKELTITVNELPLDNRPPDFSGAVGQFDLKAGLSRSVFAAGDPITLSVEVSGRGNFDAVSMPTMKEHPEIRTYPPSEEFTPRGWGGGRKIFNQGVIIKSSSVTEIPPLHLSYFDPKQQKYVTKSTAPLAVSVSDSTSAPPPGRDKRDSSTARPQADTAEKLPLKSGPGRPGSLVPLSHRPWYLVALTTALLTAVSAEAVRRYRSSRHRAERAGQRLIISRLAGDLASVEKALTAGDGRLFLDTCRVAIQNRLARTCGMHASAVSSSDLRRVLEKDSILLEVFEMAEKSAYGGEIPSEFEMDQLFPIIKKTLENFHG